MKAFKEYELDRVNEAAKKYAERLAGVVKTLWIPEGVYSSWAQYTIQLENSSVRDELQATLKENEIPSMVYYLKPMHGFRKLFMDKTAGKRIF